VGDTPDDIVAARGAGVVPVGVSAPGEASPAVAQAMAEAGAARIIADLSDLERMLP
jgi:phosphoglycolate phosphatase-like HAD superfamily hydrolase